MRKISYLPEVVDFHWNFFSVYLSRIEHVFGFVKQNKTLFIIKTFVYFEEIFHRVLKHFSSL